LTQHSHQRPSGKIVLFNNIAHWRASSSGEEMSSLAEALKRQSNIMKKKKKIGRE
jgi:hypothetical protein